MTGQNYQAESKSFICDIVFLRLIKDNPANIIDLEKDFPHVQPG